MSTSKQIVIQDQFSAVLTVTTDPDNEGMITAQISGAEIVQLDEADRKDLRDFLQTVS